VLAFELAEADAVQSACSCISGISLFGRFEARSIPISRITSTTAGHTPSRRGSWPADSARTSSGTRRLNSASAICERPAALARLEELRDAEWTRDDTAERMRSMYEYRRSRLAARAGETDDGDGYEHRSRKYQKMVRAVIEAQRAEIVRLRNVGLISNEIMHRVERELDLEDERLEI
jgi:hypothetical protein